MGKRVNDVYETQQDKTSQGAFENQKRRYESSHRCKPNQILRVTINLKSKPSIRVNKYLKPILRIRVIIQKKTQVVLRAINHLKPKQNVRVHQCRETHSMSTSQWQSEIHSESTSQIRRETHLRNTSH